jgi:hypothetical protein
MASRSPNRFADVPIDSRPGRLLLARPQEGPSAEIGVTGVLGLPGELLRCVSRQDGARQERGF